MVGAPWILTGSISPSKLEVNLGPLPVDYYDYTSAVGYFPDCTGSVRACMQGFLANYAAQGVTGVRFQFGLGGGQNSTPFDANGNWQAGWIAKLSAFFQDAYAVGIRRVTPTPVMVETWSGPLTY
jgi:hypothetical protein